MKKGQVVLNEVGEKYVFIENKRTKMVMFSYKRNGFIKTQIREMKELDAMAMDKVALYEKEFKGDSFEDMRIGDTFLFKNEKYILCKVNRTRVVIMDMKGNVFNLPKGASIEPLDERIKVHQCKYCKHQYTITLDSKDELCDSCKKMFGHEYYSEL